MRLAVQENKWVIFLPCEVASKCEFTEVTKGHGAVQRVGKISFQGKTYYLEGKLKNPVEQLKKVKFVLWNRKEHSEYLTHNFSRYSFFYLRDEKAVLVVKKTESLKS